MMQGSLRFIFKKKTEKAGQPLCPIPQYFQMVVLADSGIKSVADLKGKILTLDRMGNTGELLSRQVLQVYGLSYKDMAKVHHVSYSDSADLMKDGHAEKVCLKLEQRGAGGSSSPR
jgi:TRAP transporter TAXI family solute receptor